MLPSARLPQNGIPHKEVLGYAITGFVKNEPRSYHVLEVV